MVPSFAALRLRAQIRGGECLSERYTDLNSAMQWQCAHGHVWQATARTVWQGSWCPFAQASERRSRTCGGSRKAVVGAVCPQDTKVRGPNCSGSVNTDTAGKQSPEVYSAAAGAPTVPDCTRLLKICERPRGNRAAAAVTQLVGRVRSAHALS